MDLCDEENDIPDRLLGKPFGSPGLRLVREEIQAGSSVSRAELARRICRRLDWRSPSGAYQFMSARVGLLRLHGLGLIQLPRPRNGNGNGQQPRGAFSALFDQTPVALRVDLMSDFFLRRVNTPEDSATFNALVAQFHYLGYSPMAGAQLRYLFGGAENLLGAISFGASAWSVAARDQFIDWSLLQRKRGLHLIVNNSRFLIAPWVQSANLASRVLGLCARRLPSDFRNLYGYAPVLLETFVERDRFTGESYRAANWQCLGVTQGRGKKGQRQEAPVPRKTVWVYPLHRKFRDILKGKEG